MKAHAKRQHERMPLRALAERQVDNALPAAGLSTEDLLHQLQVHQVELEIQNEALRAAQIELEASRDRYVDLYDFAPVGYLTLTADGMIEEINFTAAALLGMERKSLLLRRFTSLVVAEDQSRWMQLQLNGMKSGGKDSVEVAMQRGDGSVFQAQLDCQRAKVGAGEAALRIALTDISERKQAEEALRSSERRFQDIAQASADWVWEVNAEGIYTFASDNVLDLLGYTAAEIVGKTPFDFMPAEEAERVGLAFAAIIGRCEPFRELDNTLCHKDGSLRQVQTSGVPILSADGKLLGYRGMDRDITERKSVEVQLRKFSQAVEQSSESIIITNVAAEIEYVNNAFLLATGYRRDEVIGRNPRVLNSGKTPPETFVALWDALSQGRSWKGQFCNRRKDGSEYVEFAIITPLREADGSISHYVAVKDDITEKKRLGEELDHYRQHLEDLVAERTAELSAAVTHTRLIIDSSAEGILQLDENGIIGLINPAACQMLGYSPAELLGRDVHAAIHCPPGAAAPHVPCSLGIAMRAGQTLREEAETFWRADGRPLPVTVATHPMLKGDAIIGAVMSFSDNTQRQASEDAREAARAAAELLAQTRSEFLANMSHEIRTPINAVLGFAYLCLKLELPPRERDYLNKIHSASESLLGIVNDILDVSKMEAGKLEMEAVPFNLDDVLQRVAGLFILKAREKGIELVFAAVPGIPDGLLGDPLRLGQVLINLMSNALKFTERGEIRLIVELLAVSADAVRLRFEVRDTGLGMSPAQLSKLFTPFSQADSSTTRKFGGTGLGLVISKQLVQRMDGEIGVESEPGAGSCFSFTARFGLAAGLAAPLSAHSSLTGRQVLIVDDNDSMRKLFTQVCRTFGCQVEGVNSGAAALARLQAGARFDVILLDWNMPDMDGLATAHGVRTAGYTMPIILITGGDAMMAQAQAKAGDIQTFLAKPVSRSTLHDAMVGVFGGPAVLPSVVAQQGMAPDFSGARILLVDDNDFNRQVGRELVEITGATVHTAEDGAQAVVAATPGGYDLVLMDLQMPVMDGYTAARIIRELWPDLPILALTAHAMSEETARVLAAGMNDIITKPILPDALYVKLERWLPRDARRDRAMPAVPPAPTIVSTIVPTIAPTIVPTSARAATATADIFDFATALTRVNGDHKMLDRFLSLFRDRNADIVTQIDAALAAQDLTTARRLAHALNGGAGTVGLVELQITAARLEATLAAALDGMDEPARCNEDFAALAAAWPRAMAALAAVLDTAANEQASGQGEA